MSNRNKIIVVALIILFIATGFFREFVFLNWNEQIRVSFYDVTDSHVASSMQWLSGFSYEALWWLKWPLTLFFSALFAFYSYILVRIIFQEANYTRLVVLAYTAVFAAGFLVFSFGWLISNKSAMEIGRFLAGIIETPAMLVILIASFMIHRRL
jgi:hypothetical protein